MSIDGNVKEILDNVNNNFEKEMQIQKIRVEVLKKFDDYRKTINYMAADAPLQILCLPNGIEKILLREGFLRVYDLFNINVDLVKIKGLGIVRTRELTTCLDKFFSML